MNRKIFLSICTALLLAPGMMAQPVPMPVPVPQRRPAPRSNIVVPTNSPATIATPNQAAAPNRFAPGAPPAIGAPAAAVPPSPAPATPTAAPAPDMARQNVEVADISYNFPGVPLKQLLDIYADLVGRTLLRANQGPEAVPETTTITLSTQSKLTRSEAIVALETILGMNGITIVPIGDKFAKVVTEAMATSAGAQISTNTNNIPIAGKMITQIVPLKYIDPKDLIEVLQQFSKTPKAIIIVQSTQTLILRDYAENVARMLEMVEKLDVLTPNSIKPEVIAIKYALASDIASALGALGASGGTAVGKNTSGATSFSRGTGTTGTGGIGGTGGMGGAGGSYPGQPGQNSTSGLGSAATSGRSAFQNNLQRIVNTAASSGQFQLFGQTKIIADERTNS